MQTSEIKALVTELTLPEKAGLCSGNDNWNTKTVQRLGVPACRTSDGPHGLRTQAGNVNSLSDDASIEAVCFPAACATAASFDRQLVARMGEELGRECQAAGVTVLLGPGINMKRSPLCGRNFEYFSEDPLLAGELGAAFVQGLQSQGVGASLKHFFANNQEHRRMDTSSEMDERTMREIYLSAFETVVKKAQPWTVMAAYNKIDGVFATANKKYLTDVLRGEWGFEGLVMSDWGATHNRAAAVEGGCDLTMPAENTDDELVLAVQQGTLARQALDTCCERVLRLAFKGQQRHTPGVDFNHERGHNLAREVAANSIVLLKNERGMLPLNKASRVAFIGGFAKAPRYQGGGSSHINSFKASSALQTAQSLGLPVAFAQGYNNLDGTTNDALIAEAVSLAKQCSASVVFVGLPEIMESEGVDRTSMNLPQGHNRLVQEVCAAQPNTVVVLHNGSPVEMPWAADVLGIVEAYLGGQAVGEAVVDVLYGDVNPSGHLAESFPKKLADSPSYLFFPDEGNVVKYSERMFIGYRYYESKEVDVLFPFGHGLSYTTFSFDALTADKTALNQEDVVTISVDVTNTGNCGGKALVQLYVAPPKGEVIRPVRELKAFDKVSLQPGESKTVSMKLAKREFAFWNPAAQDWCVESGAYRIQIGENAHSILLQLPLEITAQEIIFTTEYTQTTSMNEFSKHPNGKRFIEHNIGFMIARMTESGLIPKEFLGAIGYQKGEEISLRTIENLAQHAGVTATEGSGIGALMSQPISILLNTLPGENKLEFEVLLSRLNKRTE